MRRWRLARNHRYHPEGDRAVRVLEGDHGVGLPLSWTLGEGPNVILLRIVVFWLAGRQNFPSKAAFSLTTGKRGQGVDCRRGLAAAQKSAGRGSLLICVQSGLAWGWRSG